MGTASLVPVVDQSDRRQVMSPAAEIELDDLQDARRDPAIKNLLSDATAEGERVKREGRKRW
jgi:hypothetical protein